MHLTETCDSDSPNLITNIEATAAIVYDATMTPAIHAALRAEAVAAGQCDQAVQEGVDYSGLSRRARAAGSAGLVRWASNPAW